MKNRVEEELGQIGSVVVESHLTGGILELVTKIQAGEMAI
jgi:hypothetical protein